MSQVIIGDIIPYTQAIATAGQTVFGTNWTANVASDVVVYLTPAGQEANDVTQILAFPAQYSVAFIGSAEEVQVTLVVAAALGDRVTIIRDTPADRMNLYTNTNFTPSMLNQDFGILTLVDQQAQLVDQLIGPRYNYSAVIAPNFLFPTANTILPILEANQVWVKNDTDTAIIGLDVPSGGFAPADASYVTLTDETIVLPNSFPLSSLGAGLLVNNPSGTNLLVTDVLGTLNQITVTNGSGVGGSIVLAISDNPIMPGTAGMGIPSGTTAERVIPLSNISFRFNSDLDSLEFFSNGVWVQINDTTDGIILPGLQNELAYYAADGNTLSGLTGINSSLLSTTNLGVLTWLPLTDGQIVIGSTAGSPAAASLAAGSGVTITPGPNTIIISATGSGGTVSSISAGTGITLTPDPIVTTGSIALTVPVTAPLGGSGVISPTIHGILVAQGASPFTPIVLTNGQLLIGSTGLDPVAANLTAGPGISIANAAGTITISGTGSGIGWTEVTGTSQAMVSDAGYVANNAALVTLTLPTTAVFGSALTVIGKGAGGWKIVFGSGQKVQVGNLGGTVTTGSIASTNQFDSIELICTTANTTWTTTGGPQGNLTIV